MDVGAGGKQEPESNKGRFLKNELEALLQAAGGQRLREAVVIVFGSWRGGTGIVRFRAGLRCGQSTQGLQELPDRDPRERERPVGADQAWSAFAGRPARRDFQRTGSMGVGRTLPAMFQRDVQHGTDCNQASQDQPQGQEGCDQFLNVLGHKVAPLRGHYAPDLPLDAKM